MSALSLAQVAEIASGILPREVEKLRPEMQTRLGLAGWATPKPRDAKSEAGSQRWMDHPRGKDLSKQTFAWTPGAAPSGSDASTARRGALNPAFSLWLQGYPPQWMALAPSAESVRSAARAMRSRRKPPPSS